MVSFTGYWLRKYGNVWLHQTNCQIFVCLLKMNFIREIIWSTRDRTFQMAAVFLGIFHPITRFIVKSFINFYDQNFISGADSVRFANSHIIFNEPIAFWTLSILMLSSFEPLHYLNWWLKYRVGYYFKH